MTYNHIDDVSNSKYYWNDNTATAGGLNGTAGAGGITLQDIQIEYK